MNAIETRRIELDSDGISLKGELTICPGAGVPLVVLCHGLPMSKPDPSDGGYPLLARQICERGCSTLFVNFRGTGDSAGNFHLGGWYRDLEAVMRFTGQELSGQFPQKYIAGFSMGGSLAIRFAAEHGGVGGVAAFASPARISELFPRENLMAFIELARDVGIIREVEFPPTPDWFFQEMEQSDALDHVGQVSPVPLLLIHGESDDLVSLKDAQALFDAAGDPKELAILDGGEHKLRKDPRVVTILIDWIKRLREGA